MDSLDELRDEILPILLPYGLKKVAVFGSLARGESGPGSDLDLLVSFNEPIGLLRLARVRRELEIRVGRKVDLVTEGALSRYMWSSVGREQKVLYEV